MHPLDQIKRARMPFGRFAGEHLLELPVAYLLWFEQRGWPQGRLGEQLATVLTIKQNGLMHLLWEGSIARATGATTPEDAAQALLRMMQEICRDRWGFTKPANAEIVLWRGIATPARSDVRLTRPEIDGLTDLSQRADGWWASIDADPTFVELEAWIARHANASDTAWLPHDPGGE